MFWENCSECGERFVGSEGRVVVRNRASGSRSAVHVGHRCSDCTALVRAKILHSDAEVEAVLIEDGWRAF